MRTLQQSPTLRQRFASQVNERKAASREKTLEQLGGGIFGAIGVIGHDLYQLKNSVKGGWGEMVASFGVSLNLPDTWYCFENALIPVGDRVTEIDRLIVGPGGVFLIEVKNWGGVYAAFRDNWKYKKNNQWVPLDTSPTKQSSYHQRCFYKWLRPLVPGLPRDFVHAPVVFLSVRWLGVNQCSVPVLSGVSALRKFLNEAGTVLSHEQVNSIVNAISHL